MQRLLLLLLLTPLALFSVGLRRGTAEDDIDIDLDDIEGIGVNEDGEKRLLRGNFIIPTSSVSITRRFIIYAKWKELIGTTQRQRPKLRL